MDFEWQFIEVLFVRLVARTIVYFNSISVVDELNGVTVYVSLATVVFSFKL